MAEKEELLSVLRPRYEETSLSGSSGLSEGSLAGKAGELALTWRDLSVKYTRKHQSFWRRTRYETVTVLDKVSGGITSGKIMAIMGQSGSGKTTMLAAISMRVQGNTSGELLLNGRPASKYVLTTISGFVPQFDMAFGAMTAMEHMEFMARMKMDVHMSAATRRRRINRLMRELGIGDCRYTKLASLSGGERKRLSLADQLINDPPILFCDEPTTGLDSWTAASVIGQLRRLATDSGKMVVCSIHQPASGIFDLFDEVTLLAAGRLVYGGPVAEAKRFFQGHGYTAPMGYNEAEFLLSTISDGAKAETLSEAWVEKSSKYSIDTSELLPVDEFNFRHHFAIERPGTLIQFYWLLWRSFISSKNETKKTLIELLSLVGIAFILALPYVNLLKDVDQRDIQNVQGLMYLIGCEVVFTFAYSGFYSFPPEIAILLREVASGLYTPGPYYLSKIIMMIPKAVVTPIIYTTIIYFIVGLGGNFYEYLLFIVPIVLAANAANAYGAWLSATFENISTASLVSVPIDLVTCVFSGFAINLTSLPVHLAWVKYMSIFFYPTEAMSILQWRNVQSIRCDDREGLPCMRSGQEVLDLYGYGGKNYPLDLTCLIVIFCLFHAFGFVAIVIRSKKRPVY